jgi:hypothetical protein
MGRRAPRGIELIECRRSVARGLATTGAGGASAERTGVGLARVGGLGVSRPRGAELIGRGGRAGWGLAAAEAGTAGAARKGGAAEAGVRTAKRRAMRSSKRAVARAISARGVPGYAEAVERAADAAAEAWQAREMPGGILEPQST